MAIRQLPSEGKPAAKSDSAGYSWEGRNFDHHVTAFADDNGLTPDEVAVAVGAIRSVVKSLSLAATREEQAGLLGDLATAHSEAVVACAKSRLLVPLISEAGDYALTPEGRVVEKSQELSIVTVAAPDGRKVMPVFTSTEAMQNWNSKARPIPVPGVQVAIAAAEEATDLVIVDPGTATTEFGIRRPQLESFALAKPQKPSWADSGVVAAFESISAEVANVLTVTVAPGDPQARLLGPELMLGVELKPDLSAEERRAAATQLQDLISKNETIAHSVDSLSIKLSG